MTAAGGAGCGGSIGDTELRAARRIDLNCDLGEAEDEIGIARDRELLAIVTSANVACGGHAGDVDSMRRTVTWARERGVAIGAHPSYPDRPGFGRRRQGMSADAIRGAVATQVAALAAAVAGAGGLLRHLKPHGALYHDAGADAAVAAAVAAGAVDALGKRGALVLVGAPGTVAPATWREMGFEVRAEGFCDRRYEADGRLRDRRLPGALIDEPAEAASQAVRLALRGEAVDAAGLGVAVGKVDTLCVHSDSPGAVAIARAVRAALLGAGLQVGV